MAKKKESEPFRGSTLRALRRHKGMTLEAFAEAARAAAAAVGKDPGYSRSAVHSWEKGNRTPSLEQQEILAAVLGIAVWRFGKKPRLVTQ